MAPTGQKVNKWPQSRALFQLEDPGGFEAVVNLWALDAAEIKRAQNMKKCNGGIGGLLGSAGTVVAVVLGSTATMSLLCMIGSCLFSNTDDYNGNEKEALS